DRAPAQDARYRRRPPDGPGRAAMDDPFRHDHVDQPAGGHGRGLARHRERADGEEPGRVGEELGARAHADRVSADHPRAVPGEVAPVGMSQFDLAEEFTVASLPMATDRRLRVDPRDGRGGTHRSAGRSLPGRWLGRSAVLWANPGAVRTAYHRVVRELLRSVWAEPRPPDPPARVCRDWALVGVAVPLALLEGLLRPDPSSRAFSVVIALALAPTLLWRRTRPLLMATIAFTATGVAPLLSGHEPRR